MATRFVPVPDLNTLDDWLPRSGVVVLFLHAPRCGISVRAYRQVARLGGEVGLVDVSRDHAVATSCWPSCTALGGGWGSADPDSRPCSVAPHRRCSPVPRLDQDRTSSSGRPGRGQDRT